MAGIHNMLLGCHAAASTFNLVISTTQSNLNIATAATAAGWNGTSRLVVTINNGVTISSTIDTTPAVLWSGVTSVTTELHNSGIIIGCGGRGGNGPGRPLTNGSQGGTAIRVTGSVLMIVNAGQILGGGGGGGAGTTDTYSGGQYDSAGSGGGGGGGRSGNTNAAGGAPGLSGNSSVDVFSTYGGAGTSSAAGAGGTPYDGTIYYNYYAGYGGSGGGYGAGGANGNDGHVTAGIFGATKSYGGAGGYATHGSVSISNSGTILGASV